MNAEAAPALFSIHDVMPETLAEVSAIIEGFRRRNQPLPALLVVPGRRWTDGDLVHLRQWQDEGAELIAHGWLHETRPRRLFHRLHALLLSRNVAEHLALDRDGVCALMARSRDWFADHGLQIPETYIPPAWALGLTAADLPRQPFACVETLRGVYTRQGSDFRYRSLPLLGFEADTPIRARFLGFWNRFQVRRARRMGVPLRIAIHPGDPGLLLADELKQVLNRFWTPIRYQHLHA